MLLRPDRVDRVVHGTLHHAHVDRERRWAPPFGPGTAASVATATWFQWVTSPASVTAGGAADALDTPTAPNSAPTATVITATHRLRDIVLPFS